jgi:hypothetical protein
MHKSRLCAFVIDCQADAVTPAATFWSGALGRPVLPEDTASTYRALKVSPAEPMVLVQSAVGHESRIHLDIETDDLDAEVKRLEALGATRVGFVKRWWVMQAPSGQRFCVVRPQRGPLGDDANVWP